MSESRQQTKPSVVAPTGRAKLFRALAHENSGHSSFALRPPETVPLQPISPHLPASAELHSRLTSFSVHANALAQPCNKSIERCGAREKSEKH
ncbi:hypothetical protein ACFFQF_10915 [Haladaptatus pallidirubidus]|uniref:hypothetical protein n=1 Tax=Haladaptatus pallidirubidus TaxID=1008152 RepID=UPI0031E5FC90